MKDGIFLITGFEFVIGNPRAEMMDVMEADIPREPLQDFGKLIERTTVHASLEELPILVAFPISGVKVVLDVEQPHARAAGHQQDGDFDQQIRLPANMIDSPTDKSQQCNIRPDDTVFLAFARAFIPKAMREYKDDESADGKQDEGIPHHAITELLVPGRGDIFLHRHRVHIASAAAVEVTGGGMVDGVRMFPGIIRSPDRYSKQKAESIIGKRGLEE